MKRREKRDKQFSFRIASFLIKCRFADVQPGLGRGLLFVTLPGVGIDAGYREDTAHIRARHRLILHRLDPGSSDSLLR